jgi:hypothetical protein
MNVDTAVTYQSGPMVIIFLAVCALIVVAQLVPAIVMMGVQVYAIFKRPAKKVEVWNGE